MHDESGRMTVAHNPLKKYKILIVGIILLSSGVVMYAVAISFLSAMSLCTNATNTSFVPNTTIRAECTVVQDVGQELTFRAAFHSQGRADPIAIPAHLEIRDSDNHVFYDMDFNDEKIIVSFKPVSYDGGTYAATLTSLEDENNRIHTGSPRVLYGFGFLTSYNDVNNPLGNALLGMVPLATVIGFAGIVIIVYGIYKAIKKRHNNHLH